MRIPRPLIAEYGAEAYRRLSEAPLTPQRCFLLGDWVDAYLQGEGSERERFWRILDEKSTQGVRAMHKTRVEVAEEKARRAAVMEITEAILADRFGPLSEESLAKLRAMSDDALKPLAINVHKATSLDELGL